MTILGIDPGLKNVGYGVVLFDKNGISSLDHGTIHTESTSSLSQRLLFIGEVLKQLTQTFQPSLAGVETPIYAKNPKAALNVAQARGAILLTLSLARVPILEYHPWEIKTAVLGQSSGEKDQVAFMVRKLLHLELHQLRTSHESDALAVALACSLLK